MAIKSLTKIRPHVWIPPTQGALHKIEITRSDGATDDITDVIYEGELTDGATDTIGSFNFLVDNSGENYTNVWSGNEVIKIYIDYATTATTSRFRGRIEKVSYQGYKIKITGRSESLKLLDITVTQSYTDTEASEILKDLFDNYGTDFTYNNVNNTSTSITINWYQKPFWECIKELCERTSFSCYIDSSLDCHFFEQDSVDNNTEAIVHESNLFEVGDFAYDYSQIKNRVIVYGKKIEDLPLIYTDEDTTSQDSYGIKELIINDNNITNLEQAEERATYELNISKDPPLVGTVTSIGLATIQPGERIKISAPNSNLQPNYYRILKYTHKFMGFMKTTVTIQKEPKAVYHILRDRISQERKIAEMPNIYEMKYSWNFDFNSDTGTHSNTEITDSVLKLQTGQSSGSWISESKSLSFDVLYGEIRAVGETLTEAEFYISTDGGSTWQSISLNSQKTFSPQGRNLKLKVVFNSADTQIESLALLYKT